MCMLDAAASPKHACYRHGLPRHACAQPTSVESTSGPSLGFPWSKQGLGTQSGPRPGGAAVYGRRAQMRISIRRPASNLPALRRRAPKAGPADRQADQGLWTHRAQRRHRSTSGGRVEYGSLVLKCPSLARQTHGCTDF